MWTLRAGRPLGSTPKSECTSERSSMRTGLGWSHASVACSCVRSSIHPLLRAWQHRGSLAWPPFAAMKQARVWQDCSALPIQVTA